MKMPEFTAEAGLEQTTGHYGGIVLAIAGGTGEFHPALVAPTVCRTSRCFNIGGCRREVRCCRTFFGSCRCSVRPCFLGDIGPVLDPNP